MPSMLETTANEILIETINNSKKVVNEIFDGHLSEDKIELLLTKMLRDGGLTIIDGYAEDRTYEMLKDPENWRAVVGGELVDEMEAAFVKTGKTIPSCYNLTRNQGVSQIFHS